VYPWRTRWKFYLIHFCLFDKVIVFVKDEYSNLNTLTDALKSIIFWSPFQLPTPFVRFFWPCNVKGSSICHQWCQSLFNVSLKVIQTSLQKNITWTKKSGKGKQECKYVCIIVRLLIRLFKTLMKTCFASKIILFQKILEYQNAIPICYAW